MSLLETQIKNMLLKQSREIAELRKIIVTRLVPDKWVNAATACALLNVKRRQLANIRLHLDKDGKNAGSISWKKGKGKNCLYYLPDIEKYNSAVTIMN